MKKILIAMFSVVMLLMCACVTIVIEAPDNENVTIDISPAISAEIYESVEAVANAETDEAIRDLSEFKQVTVKRVVDGDTFIYEENGSKVRVRMLMIDTPESVAPEETGKVNTDEGKEASDYTKSLIDGQTVYLEYDVRQYDDFDRELAYVYLEDGRMVQEILLSEGLAKMVTFQPNVKYVEEFSAIQKEARENKRGFWDGFFDTGSGEEY